MTIPTLLRFPEGTHLFFPFSRGLLALVNSEEELAAVMANEIGSELDVFLSVLVPAPLTKTAVFLQLQSNSKDIPGIIFIQEIIGQDPELTNIFNKVNFDQSEKVCIEYLQRGEYSHKV